MPWVPLLFQGSLLPSCPGWPGLPLVRRVCRHLQVVNNTIFLINVGLRLCFVRFTGWGQKWSSAMIKNILILFCFVKPYCLFQDKYLGSKMLIVAWGYKPRWGGHLAPARNLLTSEGNICHSTLLNFHRKTRTFVRFWISAEQQTKALVCFCVSLYVCLLSVKQALLFCNGGLLYIFVLPLISCSHRSAENLQTNKQGR